MRAAVIRDRKIEIQDRPTPRPEAHQVLVEVAGAGINRVDLVQRAGRYPAPPGWPKDIPGVEFAGTVAAIGAGVDSLRQGDRVFGILGGGGHSTHIITTESLCSRVPDGLDLVAAGGVPETFITAHDAMVTQAELKSGERVLIHGVGSGVGTAAVQIAHAMGAATVGTARTPGKLDRARELGLDEGVLATDDMADRIGPVDVVVDLVGGDYLKVDVAVCRPTGRIMLVGLLAGASVDLDLGALLSRRLTLKGTTLRGRPEWQKAAATAAFAQQIVPWFASGALRPVVDRLMTLDEISGAFDLLASNETYGKLIIAM